MDRPIRLGVQWAAWVLGAVLGAWLSAPSAEAASTLDALSSKDATGGLRAALEKYGLPRLRAAYASWFFFRNLIDDVETMLAPWGSVV